MAKILQVIDVDSDGFKVRLDNGEIVRLGHSTQHPQVGDLIEEEDDAMDTGRVAKTQQEGEHAKEA